MRGWWRGRLGAIASVGDGFKGCVFDLVDVESGRSCSGGRRGFVGTGGDGGSDGRYIGNG